MVILNFHLFTRCVSSQISTIYGIYGVLKLVYDLYREFCALTISTFYRFWGNPQQIGKNNTCFRYWQTIMIFFSSHDPSLLKIYSNLFNTGSIKKQKKTFTENVNWFLYFSFDGCAEMNIWNKTACKRKKPFSKRFCVARCVFLSLFNEWKCRIALQSREHIPDSFSHRTVMYVCVYRSVTNLFWECLPLLYFIKYIRTLWHLLVLY